MHVSLGSLHKDCVSHLICTLLQNVRSRDDLDRKLLHMQGILLQFWFYVKLEKVRCGVEAKITQ